MQFFEVEFFLWGFSPLKIWCYDFMWCAFDFSWDIDPYLYHGIKAGSFPVILVMHVDSLQSVGSNDGHFAGSP
jgi:hypothetical protein